MGTAYALVENALMRIDSRCLVNDKARELTLLRRLGYLNSYFITGQNQ